MQYTKGQHVRVSDNTPEPPARFRKKHASWKCRNYTGFVWRHDAQGVAVDKTGQGVFCMVERPERVSLLDTP